MPFSYSTVLGKSIQRVARLRGGSGSALPGLVVEKIDRGFMKRTLDQLKHGVIVVSGTNGKTTTTKMIVSLLESQGLRVFTNRTGSNFTRGVTAALLDEVSANGELSADIAVLELDEAHAVHFVRQVKPAYSVFLNVLRDQLDRFGEIDTTASLLHTVAVATTDGIVINRDDPRLINDAFQSGLAAGKIYTYGVSDKLRSLFPTDDSMRDGANHAPTASTYSEQNDIELLKIDGTKATFKIAGNEYSTSLQLKGAYNIQNAAAAIATVRLVIGSDVDNAALLSALSAVKPAFGRGETVIVDGTPVELVLVKNPSGFRLSLASFDNSNHTIMIAINDNFADGRDMSWLWDVEFDSLLDIGVDTVTGIRAYDMALRLQYDCITMRSVETSIKSALQSFVKQNPEKPKRIYCSYTAMLALRRELSKMTSVEVIS